MYFLETSEGDVEASADTFDEAVAAAIDYYPNHGTYLITWGIEGARTRTRVAYHADRDPLEIDVPTRTSVLRIVEPAYASEQFQPGSSPVVIEFNRRDYTFIPVLAPEVTRWPFLMSRTSVRGAEYPDAIRSYVYGFRDSSWKNDTVDSITFAIAGVPYTIWINETSLLRWNDESPSEWYSMYRLVTEDNGEPLEVDDSLDNREIDMDADSLIETNDPAELLRFIADLAQAEDPSVMRARMLDLSPAKRRSSERTSAREDDLYKRAKLIQEELAGDDPTVNPRGRRGKKNPSASSEHAELAKEKFEEFHRHAPTKIFSAKTPMPTRVKELGPSLFVLYSSTKNDPDTGLPVKNAVRYIHEHDSAGVTSYVPVASGGVEVPAFIRDCTAVVRLGKCLGYAWTDEQSGGERERTRLGADLYATPCGRALLVIKDRRDVIAMVWGGALGVESRGIVG